MSAERPRLLVPGLLPADPALERYRVHPRAVTAVELDPGDVLTVIDEEGRQHGELTVLAGGAEDYQALGTEPDTAATVLRALATPLSPPPWPDAGSTPAPPPPALPALPPPLSPPPWPNGGSTPARRGRWRCSASGRRPGPGRRSPPSVIWSPWWQCPAGRCPWPRTTRPRTWCWRSGGSARAGRSSARCRRRWPIHCSTCGWTPPRHGPTRLRPASTSR